MRTKRLLALLLAGALLVTACGGNGDAGGEEPTGDGDTQAAPQDDETPATDALWWEDIEGGPIEIGVLPAEGTAALAFLEEVATGLENDYPGTDATLTFANTQARPALDQRWRGGNPLDVDYNLFDATNENLLNWADEGFLLDLRPYLEQEHPDTGEPWIDQFEDAALNFMVHPEDNGIYGVPSEVTNHVLFYNAGMFEELGITPPTTWDEFVDAGEALKEAGVDPIAVSGLIDFYVSMWPEHAWLRTVGYDEVRAALTKGEGSVLDHPGYLEGLEMIQDIRDRDFFIEGFEGGDFTAIQAQFFQGDAGFILMGTWLISEMADVIPEDFEVGVLPFPEVPGGAGDQNAVMSAANNMSVAADSEVIPLGLEWIRRLTSQEVQTERAEVLGQSSAVTGVPSPDRMEGLEDLMANASSLEARHYGLLEFESKDVVMQEFQRLFFGEQDAEETLQRIDDGLQRLFG